MGPQPTDTLCSGPCGSRSSDDNGKAQRYLGSYKTLHKHFQKAGVPKIVKSRFLHVGKIPSLSRKNTIPIYGRAHETARKDLQALNSSPSQPGSFWISFPANSVLRRAHSCCFAGWKRAAASKRTGREGSPGDPKPPTGTSMSPPESSLPCSSNSRHCCCTYKHPISPRTALHPPWLLVSHGNLSLHLFSLCTFLTESY